MNNNFKFQIADFKLKKQKIFFAFNFVPLQSEI